MSRRLVIFDIDGTLINSGDVICRAMRAAFAEQAVTPPDDARIRSIIGLSLLEAIRRLMPPGAADHAPAIADAYARHYRPLAAEPPLYEGVRELLEALDDEGFLIGAATGKSRRGLDHAFEHHRIGHHFVASRTADQCPGKPHPAMINEVVALAGVKANQAVMIGDTTYDMQMAVSAGCGAVGVSWGYHDVSALRDAGAEPVADDMAHLGRILRMQRNLS